MGDELTVWLGGKRSGRLLRVQGRVAFSYDSEYRQEPGVPPLSWSMPLIRADHEPAVVEPWLDNLLPDSDAVRARWAQELGLFQPTPFDLLERVGEDCPGAIQIMPPGRTPDQSGGRQLLSESDIADEIGRLRATGSDGWFPDPSGHWSLGGAQPKLALGQSADGTWYRPTGRVPSTHILKVGFTGKADSDWAEHVTASIAHGLGLAVARTQMLRFAGERAMVVRRFDRLEEAGRIRRLHQEDFCQALGLSRYAKYESAGGPGIERLAELITGAVGSRHAAITRQEFARAVVFNWITASPDAHAKNYALLYTGSTPRLAPLFDLASASLLWPAAQVEFSGRLAMSLGGEFRLFAIVRKHLVAAAQSLRVDESWLLGEAERQLDALMPTAEAILGNEPDIDSAIAERFHTGLAVRLKDARRAIAQ
jgi:serine/threonine-protein kinase HipA